MLAGAWQLTTESEIVAVLKRRAGTEVYKAYDDSWQVLGLGRFHDIAPGLIEEMAASGKLVPRWPDVDGCYVLSNSAKA